MNPLGWFGPSFVPTVCRVCGDEFWGLGQGTCSACRDVALAVPVKKYPKNCPCEIHNSQCEYHKDQ